MSNRCTRTDNYRAEMQVLLKHNQKVIKHIETSDAENVALTITETSQSSR
ncbi:hypothetical protein F441_14948 [Phytophthora nicotianae CJ01A1]|uniref:Uncharacterized protein n=1 Tax=Phytophthora nicotianae CJ01A1 TaxID=1317063 RepID=W2WF13_PHYNI|nr:hypothetical protein F441_14948 [Phytophthora nicotianae CJ01A1]